MRRVRRLGSLASLVSGVAVNRLRNGPAYPTWTFGYELLLGVLRPRFLQDRSVEAARRGIEASPAFGALKGLTWRPEVVGGVPCVWLEPKNPTPHVLVYLHGGGYVVGSPKSHRPLLGALARGTRARVLAVDYRLAPEHPCPAAIDDAVAAVAAVYASGVKPEHVRIAGDSAGGGLTVATLVALRDRGLPLPKVAALLSPWTDLAVSGEEPPLAHLDYLPGGERLATFGRHYAGTLPMDDPRASPLFANLVGLPPLLILAGGAERILPDSTRLAEAAVAAGVSVTLHVEPGDVHVYPMFHRLSPGGRDGIRRLAAFLA